MELTAYQKQFAAKLTGDMKTQVEEIFEFANSSATVQDFVTKLPEGYAPFLKGITTIEAALDRVLVESDWGPGNDYKPPKPTVSKKAMPKASTAPATTGTAPTPAAAKVPSKRTGNPEALAKAREARAGKTTEQAQAERQLVVNAVVADLKAKGATKAANVAIPVKDFFLVENSVLTSLRGKGANGADLTESFIYNTLTEAAKSDTCPFVAVDMDKRRRGYQLR